MALKIRSIGKLVQDTGLKILIHGMAGSGKTVMCCTAGEPTLLISAESGLLSIKDAPKYIKGIEIENLDDLEDIYEYLYNEEEPHFKWIALDSITEIAEQVFHAEKSISSDPRKLYPAMQDRMMEYMRKFRDLSKKGYNVVVSCKQQRISEDGGPTLYAPMMPGQKLHQQLPYLFDEVFAIRVETDENGEPYHIIQTKRDLRYEAKDRSGELDLFEEPNLKMLAKKMRGIKTVSKKSQQQVEKLKEQLEKEDDEVEEQVETAEEPETVEEHSETAEEESVEIEDELEEEEK